MKNFLLENWEVEELSAKESQEINGGIFGIDDLVVGVVAGLIVSALDHWSDIKKGAVDAWNGN